MGLSLKLSIILIISDVNIVPKYRINMIIIIHSQKLLTHPIFEKAIKQFQGKIKMKVSGWEHRKLAHPTPQQYEGRHCYFLKTVLMKPLLWGEWGKWKVLGLPSLFTRVRLKAVPWSILLTWSFSRDYIQNCCGFFVVEFHSLPSSLYPDVIIQLLSQVGKKPAGGTSPIMTPCFQSACSTQAERGRGCPTFTPHVVWDRPWFC